MGETKYVQIHIPVDQFLTAEALQNIRQFVNQEYDRFEKLKTASKIPPSNRAGFKAIKTDIFPDYERKIYQLPKGIDRKETRDECRYMLSAIHPQKAVIFQPIKDGIYNLALTAVDKYGNILDDYGRLTDVDWHEVLLLVTHIMADFTILKPKSLIFITGSTPARTRLTRMAITQNLPKFRDIFFVWGIKEINEHTEQDLTAESFTSNMNYRAFLIQRK